MKVRLICEFDFASKNVRVKQFLDEVQKKMDDPIGMHFKRMELIQND